MADQVATSDLSTGEGMLEYVNKAFRSCTQVVELAGGGFSGYVYRVTLEQPLDDGSQTVVVKHVKKDAARVAFNLELDPRRIVYEQYALKYLQPLLSHNGSRKGPWIGLPGFHSFSPANNTLVMQDVGQNASLKNWLNEGTSTQVAEAVGVSLADFLYDLHQIPKTQPSAFKYFESNTHGRTVSTWLYYERLAAEAAKFGHEESYIADAAAQAREEVLTAQAVMSMGDFWTGNILVCSNQKDAAQMPRLFVVDWELARPGTAEFDIGQMVGEMFFLTKFASKDKGQAILDSFLRTYANKAEIDVYKLAIRVGAHLVVIGQMTNPKATKEAVAELVEDGVAYIKAGWTRDEMFLRESCLKASFH